MPNRRPQLQLLTPAASPEEAAAVMAAVEQFMRDTAPLPEPATAPHNPWTRAGLLEGVGYDADGGAAPADAHPWG
jgi:hypothetical protein